MAVTAEQVLELRKLGDGYSSDGPMVLETIPEILAYVATVARAEGRDEADDVELLCRAANMSRAEVLEAHRVLRPLGYVAVCDRLRMIVRHAPRPRQRGPQTFMERLRAWRASRV
jgi:hypothetical protein